MNPVETYTDKVSGKTLYIKRIGPEVKFYKDLERTIMHREDGPAWMFPSGTWAWYQNGKLHRMDGPASFYKPGNEYTYFINEIPLNRADLWAQ